MPPRLLALVFGVVGAALLALSLVGLVSEWRFGQRASSAPGEVVRLNAGGSHPEIRFVTEDGQTVEYPQNGLVGGYRTGDRVTVLYDPADPHRAVVDRFGARYGFAGLGGILAAAFLMVAIVQGRKTASVRPDPAARGR